MFAVSKRQQARNRVASLLNAEYRKALDSRNPALIQFWADVVSRPSVKAVSRFEQVTAR